MYRVYVRELGETRGHGVLDLDSLAEIREEIRTMDFPGGSFVYVKYGRPGYYGGSRPDRPIEAYRVEDGQLVGIFSRYKGGEWPTSWSLTPLERLTIERFGGDIREESKRRWLEEEAGSTYGIPAEEPGKFRRLRLLLSGLGVESEEVGETLRSFGKRE